MLRAALLLHCFLHCSVSADPGAYVHYLVVGAGPGGLQIGHYLESAGRDYLILEAASAPASFFRAFPRFRQLISINKYEVGAVDALAFHERHDWNSLLSDASHACPRACCSSTTDARLTVGSVPPPLRFPAYSTDYYPRADALVAYLGAFANSSTPSRGALRVRYGSRVARVARPPAGWSAAAPPAAGARFFVATSDGAEFACRFLIWAGGLQEEVPLPSANGTRAAAAGLVATYARASAEPEAYRGKRVLVLGHGNGAWEFAHHLLPRAAYVHVAGRSRVALALENHYPGSVRAVHATLLESYNLKSLDGITTAQFERLTFAPAPGGGVVVGVAGGVGCPVDALGRPTSRCSFRKPYDAVVACLGWRFSGEPFEGAVRPALARNGKHPALTPRYESVNVPGLFFAGTLAHGVDHKKASGGFIHGFRYTARALHRYLEEEEADAADAAGAAAVGADGAPPAPPHAAAARHPRWPATRVASLRQLVALLLRRVNLGAGLYQMFGQLADVFVLKFSSRPAGGCDAAGMGLHAAMELPWEFFDAAASEAAAAGSDPTGLSDDVAAAQAPAAAPRPPRAAAAEGALDAALSGELLEEVPVAGARALARARAATEWLQLTLEFGAGPPPGEKDPFALDRADVSLHKPEASKFIHPVLRYFSSAAPGCGGVEEGGGSCAPIAELHIVEDFFAEWRLHSAHVLPLGRFLQAVGTARWCGGGAPPTAPWQPPPLPPPFLAGVLQLLLAGCDATTTLFWRGSAFRSLGSEEGWWLKLSVAAQASLAELRFLAVHGVDALPGVPRSPEEEAHTAAVKERWALARAGGNATAVGDVEPPRPPSPAATPAQAAAAAAARAEEDAAYTELTARDRALGVLAVDARSGRCRALAEKLGVALGAVEVRVYEQGGGEGAAQGTATSVEAHGPLSGRKAAAHVAAILRKKRGGAQ